MHFRFVLILVIAAAGDMFSSAQAHDFWLEPEQFHVEEGAGTRINFMVGHAGAREHWNLKKERVVSLRVIGENSIADLAGHIEPGRNGGADMVIEKDGAYIVAFESNAAFIELDAKKFNAYLEEEGLSAVQEYRRANDLGDQPGREIYSRRAKALVRAGNIRDNAHLTNALGHSLEIRPLADPFSLSGDDPLMVEVLYDGKPLPGATLSLENLRIGIFPEARRKTDDAGRAEFALPRKGVWKFNVVWSVPVEDDAADYETIFSSLTFSYD